jgi:transcriptional regulator with XRE-family HTH domain
LYYLWRPFPDAQAAFARALGFSSEFISLLEADKRGPSYATLKKT